MKVLIACEFSGIVRDAFARRGHYAMSCDLRPSERKGLHYQGDVFDIINRGWDLMIAHPPCTYLTRTANRWLKDQAPRESGALVGAERRAAQEEAAIFFMHLWNINIDRICIENPAGVMSTRFRKPDQIIQPLNFGHAEKKTTCLWLKNLPLLKATKIVAEEPRRMLSSGKTIPAWYANPAPGKDRQRMRERTFEGIAEAMAEQWSK